jgi:hypothetical protein
MPELRNPFERQSPSISALLSAQMRTCVCVSGDLTLAVSLC